MNFAMAYAVLGTSYSNLGENDLADENTRKAYELRERVSEREKFYIESHYHTFVTGDLEKAGRVYEIWAQTYPREFAPPNNLGNIYIILGQFDKALTEMREALRLDPGGAVSYANLFKVYLYLDRLDEARSAVGEAQAKKLDSRSYASICTSSPSWKRTPQRWSNRWPGRSASRVWKTCCCPSRPIRLLTLGILEKPARLPVGR